MSEPWTAEAVARVGREIWPAGDGGRTPHDAPERVLHALEAAGLLVSPELLALREAAKEWRAQYTQPVPYPRMAALFAAVDALGGETR